MTDLASLFDPWGTPVELERRLRIRLCIYAYAYEIKSTSLVADCIFDSLAKQSKPNMKTGNNTLDTWWKDCFTPYTGQWIHSHPELDKIAALYERFRDAR